MCILPIGTHVLKQVFILGGALFVKVVRVRCWSIPHWNMCAMAVDGVLWCGPNLCVCVCVCHVY